MFIDVLIGVKSILKRNKPSWSEFFLRVEKPELSKNEQNHNYSEERVRSVIHEISSGKLEVNCRPSLSRYPNYCHLISRTSVSSRSSLIVFYYLGNPKRAVEKK